eukprot:CAMPEP_0202510508 /NCGR_PEP_ID=MMETSP1361-20130828/53331_1 /ASSEMBLY_ACC=CAM_ASM_000849 /TAXON_ID=210615 /ORGANISM="Staurosira complex sp., Strain CCMP2646" /LENGTH=1231 /DNA_ID=CAMNT_0049144775 /DNA_START=24 /DNA_END=3719 /DNA_ORIENTATION=+
MDINPYGAKQPPSLVTVENGFAFQDDSDLSSLNTTPRKQQDRKILLGGDQADFDLKQSKANRRLDRDPPQVVQVSSSSRGRNREDKLRDCKEKYRRMASPSSRRVRPPGGKLNSWKKKADERLEKAQKVKPWYVPEPGDDDENSPNTNEDDDEDDVSPMKAKKHTFEQEEEAPNDEAPSVKAKEELEAAPEDEKDELLKDESSSFKPANSQESVKPTAPSEVSPAPLEDLDKAVPQQQQQQVNQSIVTVKSTFAIADRSPSPQVDIYGCPIFRDDDDDDLDETRTKLDKLDNVNEQMDSFRAMLSSASFFSKTAAQTLTDASNQGVKLLGSAAQGVEELVLGPVDEGNEESEDEDVPPPPPPPRRGRSPTAIDDSTNGAARRMNQDDSVATSSFVLDDKSEVDVHFVLDDLATLESKQAIDSLSRSITKVPTEDTEPTDEQANEPVALVENKATIDESVDTDLFVSVDDARVDSIDSEIDAVCDAMDTIHVKEEVQRLEALHAQTAREAARVAEALKGQVESSPADEVSEEMKNDEESDSDEESTESASDDEAPVTTKGATPLSPAADEATEPSLENDKAEEADEIPGSPDTTTASTTPPEEEADKVEVATAVNMEDQKDSTAADVVRAAVIAGAVVRTGAPIVVGVIPEKEEEIKLDPGKIIIASYEESEEDSEFPPTDDADVDRIDFDTISVNSEGTPVRANLDDSKEVLKKEAEEEQSVQEEKKVEEPETARVTPKVNSVRNKPKKVSKSESRETSKSLSKEISSKSFSKEISASHSKEQVATNKPAMVKTLDDNNGIAKGDIVLSLLNANLSEANRAPKGGDQVRDAILRMRDMRRRQEKVEMPEYEPDESGKNELDSPSKRSALPVDVDDMRVVGAFDHVKTLEEDAIEHLKHDEIEAALELYEEIVSIYAEAFKDSAKNKRKKKDKSDHKGYIGAALHNIGILQLLRLDFEEALSFFEKAAENRKDHFGEGSVDHLASFGKIALCHYAMDEYETAHKSLEQVLELSKNHLAGLTDFMQVAEVLNNLGCLSFMCGQSGSAMTMFKECLEIQTAVLKQSLYSGPRFAGHSTSLSISVTRGNIGYVQMLTKNAGAAIIEFEASLMHQQMILSDVHDTLICTMDHLAVANLLAKNKEEATKMLGRMLRAQLAAYGASDDRCVLTLSKLQLVQTEKTGYLEKALDQLWDQHSNKASPSSKRERVAANKRSTKMMKKLSFRKKAAKLRGKD